MPNITIEVPSSVEKDIPKTKRVNEDFRAWSQARKGYKAYEDLKSSKVF